jgi:glutamate decarboxylase
VWRSHEDLPEDLIFHVNYLGGDMPTFTLNFSRPGNQIVAQYYNFLRLGRAGYTRIMEALSGTARYISSEIEKMGRFELLSRGDTIPVFAFALKDPGHYTVYDLSDHLRQSGWQVPAYTMPPKVDKLAVLRVVVREGFSRDMAGQLVTDIKKAVDHFESQPGFKSPHKEHRGKKHRTC